MIHSPLPPPPDSIVYAPVDEPKREQGDEPANALYSPTEGYQGPPAYSDEYEKPRYFLSFLVGLLCSVMVRYLTYSRGALPCGLNFGETTNKLAVLYVLCTELETTIIVLQGIFGLLLLCGSCGCRDPFYKRHGGAVTLFILGWLIGTCILGGIYFVVLQGRVY